MAHTITLQSPKGLENFGSMKGAIATLDITSYPTNGEAITPGEFRMRSIAGIIGMSSENGYMLGYDRANSKLKVYYGDYSEAGDGPLVEAPNTTDVGTFDVVVLGSD
jgi:hypothetical protein